MCRWDKLKSRKMIKLNDDQKRRILMLVVLIAIPVVMYIINYEVHTLVLGGYKCPVLHNTGLYCPGCGGRRMLKALLHGRIYQAFRYNPFLFISIPFVIVYYPVNMILFIRQDHGSVMEK